MKNNSDYIEKMKQSIGFLLLLFSLTLNGQTKSDIKQTLSLIETKTDFENIRSKNPNWTVELISLKSTDSICSKKLNKLKKGASRVIRIDRDKYYYKLIDKTSETLLRTSYIYLNGLELTKTEIDSLRPIIIKKHKKGTAFGDLVDRYTMDNNTQQGDLGWFKPSDMVLEFSNGVKKRKKSEIFMVDIERHNWYYVVLKTHKNKTFKNFTFVRIKSEANGI